MFAHPPRAFPWEQAPPVGARQITGKRRRSARARRPRSRICLRKGCRRRYVPRCWNQRYCQEAECRRQVQRWQAARRQARRRQNPAARVRDAQAQRERRQRARTTPQVVQKPELVPARGHAAQGFFRFRCVIGQAATNHPQLQSATRRATVAPPVVTPLLAFWIENASGALAAPWTAARSERPSIKPLAGADCGGAVPPRQRRYVRLRTDDFPRRAPVVNYRTTPGAWFSLGGLTCSGAQP